MRLAHKFAVVSHHTTRSCVSWKYKFLLTFEYGDTSLYQLRLFQGTTLGGKHSGTLCHWALTVSLPCCGKDALFVSNTPGSALLESTTRSSLSVCPEGLLKELSGPSVYRSVLDVQ